MLHVVPAFARIGEENAFAVLARATDLQRQGRVMGHDIDLPAQASRCANCHDAQQAAGSVRLVSPLTRAALTEPQPRRGGPPSVYDQQAFCAFLRTGIDPAYVLVDRTMPRFALDDADCNALWTYVSSR